MVAATVKHRFFMSVKQLDKLGQRGHEFFAVAGPGWIVPAIPQKNREVIVLGLDVLHERLDRGGAVVNVVNDHAARLRCV